MNNSFEQLESPYLQESVLDRESLPGWGSGAQLAWEAEAQSSLDALAANDNLAPSEEDEGLDQESLGQELWSPADQSEDAMPWGAVQEEQELAGRDAEMFDAEAWSGSAEQLAFRDSVLAAQLARSHQRRAPLPDLSSSERDLVPGTPGIEMARDAAAAAGRLLAAANAALADARQGGDSDALRTVKLSATSGYRSADDQRRTWEKYFPRYYKDSRPAREKLIGGPHSSEAVNYMLKPLKEGGFGLAGRVAAPGYSDHQKGIAIDLSQERKKGHEVPNRTDRQSRDKWTRSWFYQWLQHDNNAAFFGFQPYRFEPWHWIYRGTVSPGAGRSQPLQVPVPGPSSKVASSPGSELTRFAQVVLNASEGEQLNLDGVLGPRSKEALDRFRRKYALGAGAVLDAPTVLALAQRALEELAQASMATQYGRPDALTNQELIRFKSMRGLGFDAKLDAATLLALTTALAAGKAPARRPVVAAAPKPFLGGLLWTFNARVRALDATKLSTAMDAVAGGGGGQSIQQLALGAGFDQAQADIMAAIAMAESSGNPRAHNQKSPDNSYGLWQINMLGKLGPERRRQLGLSKNEQLFDPATNARAAKAVYDQQGFGAWSVYKSGAYKKYLGRTNTVVAGASGPAASGPTVAVFCPPAALGQREVDLLLFAHGLMAAGPGKPGCPRPSSVPDGLISGGPFHLGSIVAAANRPMVLVVPLLDWSNPGGSAAFGSAHPNWHALARPASLNALIGEVLEELGRVQSLAPPTVTNFVIAGHSRAHSFMEPLAHLHTVPQMSQGALARLVEVWSLDATYQGNPAKWQAWLDANPQLRVHVIYRSGNTPTAKVGEAFYLARGQRLLVSKTREQHCAIPNKFLPGLLAGRDTAFSQETEDPLAQEASGQDEVIIEPEGDTTAGEGSPDEKESQDFVDELDDIRQSQDAWEPQGELEEEDVVSLGDSQEQDLDHWVPADDGSLELVEEFGLDEELGLDEENAFEFEDEYNAQHSLTEETSNKIPMALPSDNPVPFAPFPPPGSYWPVRSRMENKLLRRVSYMYQAPSGVVGKPGRMFLAGRKGNVKGNINLRWHVGLDLYANINDVVVACEAGTIVNFSYFYTTTTGQRTYKLLIEHQGSGIVVNYGEVRSDSLRTNGLKIGSRVKAGQPIGWVGDSGMLHFETYVKGTKSSHRWWKSEMNPPRELLNPTRYLLELAKNGLASRARGGAQRTSSRTPEVFSSLSSL